MRKIIPVYLLMLLSAGLFAQDQIIVPPEIEVNKRENTLGHKVELNSNITTSSVREDFEIYNNHFIWSYHFKAEGAQGIVAFFDKLKLSEGTRIRAYSPNQNQTTNWFYSNPNTHTMTFALPYIEGDEMVIEVICNDIAAKDKIELDISQIGVLQAGFGDALDCFANVNCEEGDSWQDQKRAVAKYMTVTGGEIGFCSGALVNNTNEDCRNLFLSAQHCGLGASADEFGQFVFYFNYESIDCENPPNDMGIDQQTVIGCSKLSESGGATNFPPDRSDFLLLELNDIPEEYNVYYAGWNRSPLDELEGNGAIIQHPQGDIKKISFWDNVTQSLTSFDHLYTEAITSANGEGIVEPSSSGSPIMDLNKNIIGNVTAGDNDCIPNITNTPIAVGGRFEGEVAEVSCPPKTVKDIFF